MREEELRMTAKEIGKVRLVLRQSKTLKICDNHLVLPSKTVQKHAGNEKSCLWHAADFADGELKDGLFCIPFASVGNCKTFMETFQEAVESQKKEENNDASATAGLLEKLSVEEKTAEEKTGEEKAGDSALLWLGNPPWMTPEDRQNRIRISKICTATVPVEAPTAMSR